MIANTILERLLKKYEKELKKDKPDNYSYWEIKGKISLLKELLELATK